MQFELDRAIEVLSVTPSALRGMVGSLSDAWTESAGTEDAWQAYDVVGHLINADQTNWIPRAEVILAQGEDKNFPPFDRFAQFELSEGKTLDDLLSEFDEVRQHSLNTVHSWNLTEQQFSLRGIHPEFGEVSLRQLLATWVVHDLTHIRQITTAMAKKYDEAVGPWKQYLSILK